MPISAKPAVLGEIAPWRDLFREEMNCQIVHDSLHIRAGWTESYRLEVEGTTAGYGSIALAGPWTGTRTIFEFYVARDYRTRAFDLFQCFMEASGATAMEIQSNDALLNVMIHLWAHDIASEKIVFEDGLTTHWAVENVTLRHRPEQSDWVLVLDGEIVANGGVLYHYNRPYGDVYMEVAEPFRGRGYGSYLVQELKRICRRSASIPCARCDVGNVASRRTLQKAGFVPCAHILIGKLQGNDK